MRRVLSIALGFAAAYAPVASAQTAPSDAAVSTQGCLAFEDVLRLSATRDPSVGVAQALADEAEAAIEEAKALSRPRVDAIARSGFGATVVDSGVSNSLGLRASQRILDFGDAKLARRGARADFRSAQAQTAQTAQEAAAEAGLAALNASEASAQLAVTEERRTYFARLLEATDALLDRGGATRTERAAVASQLADAESFALELEFQRDRALTALEIATGAAGPLCPSVGPASLPQSGSLLTPEHAVATALERNPRVEALREAAESAEASAERERRSRLPIVDVVATGAYASFDDFDDFRFRDRVGIDVSIPLYSGNALSARRRQANARRGAAEGRVRDLERTLREDIRVTWRRIISLEDQLERRLEVERQTLLQFEAAEQEQAFGSQTLRELVEIRLEFEAAAVSVVQTRHDLARQRLALAQLTGTLPMAGTRLN